MKKDCLDVAVSRRSFMGGALAAVGFDGLALIEYERDYENNAMGLAESLGYYRGVIDALNLPLRA